jgi:hypothetical protein
MSLALFGTILLLVLIAFCWGHSRTIAAAVVAVLLGVTIASSSSPLADMSDGLIDGLRGGLTSMTGGGGR